MRDNNTPDPHGNYYQRQAYRKMRAPEIAAEKAAKAAQSMTCQCCARPIFAETGVIAHHGYERPGSGWQTASCYGARHLPWEVDRAALADLIEALTARIQHLSGLYSRTNNDAESFTWEIADKTEPRNQRTGRYATTRLTVTKDDWPSIVAIFERVSPYNVINHGHTYESRKALRLAEINGWLTTAKDHKKWCVARYDSWKPTHRKGGFNEGTWVKL